MGLKITSLGFVSLKLGLVMDEKEQSPCCLHEVQYYYHGFRNGVR